MRVSLTISLLLTMLCFAACHSRKDLDQEKSDDKSALIIEPPQPTPIPTTSPEPETADAVEEKKEPEKPIIMETPSPSPRIESLTFAHSTGLCLQISANGATNLQNCDSKAVGQKFLFNRSLDGRLQLKDTSSARCLAVGPGSFIRPLTSEVCESKASQFFSLVDYETSFSLKFDGNNTCIDAELSGTEAGTRLVMYRCSAVLNQKILQVKK